MKKIKIGVLAVLIIGGGILFCLAVKEAGTTASMKRKLTIPASSSSEVMFEAKRGEQLILKYSSKVEEGSLQMVLRNDTGTLVEAFPVGTAAVKTVTLEQDDTYFLQVVYEDFTGEYSITVRKR